MGEHGLQLLSEPEAAAIYSIKNQNTHAINVLPPNKRAYPSAFWRQGLTIYDHIRSTTELSCVMPAAGRWCVSPRPPEGRPNLASQKLTLIQDLISYAVLSIYPSLRVTECAVGTGMLAMFTPTISSF
jgi:hypothetical protein